MRESPAPLNISALIDDSRIGRYQAGVFVLFALCLIMDGFDVQAMGYVAPALIQDWKIPATQMGPVFSAGLFGLFVGSLAFGMLADRIGRRPVLLGATLAFSLLTLITARAGNVSQLLLIRFIAGVGLGAIMPNATALVGEYSPRRQRVAMMMIVTNGFTAGAMLGGFASAWLIPRFGWRSVFYAGGVIPLLIAVPMFIWLPESLQFLALRRASHVAVARWLSRIAPAITVTAATTFVVSERPREGVPLIDLFRGGRAAGTGLLWIVNFMNVLNAYFVSSWLPTVVRAAGHSTSTAVLVGTSVQAGGMIATFALGSIVQRIGFIPVLTACFVVSAANLALLGYPGLPVAALFTAAFLAGAGIFGGQPGVNSLAATYYPTDLRSTGIGSGLGIGRIGGILGPVLASELMLRHWSTRELFELATVPALVAAVSIVMMSWVIQPDRPRAQPIA